MRYIRLCMAAGLILAVSGTAAATSIWGVTGVNYWDYSEVFRVDPATGTVKIVGTTKDINSPGKGPVYGDIAVTVGGKVYTVGKNDGAENFETFYQLNPNDASIINSWTIPDADGLPDEDWVRPWFNALTAESSTTLLAIEGGGIADPHLYRIDVSGATPTFTDLGLIGGSPGPSDGDIVRNPDGSFYAGSMWAATGSDIYMIDPANVGGASEIASLDKMYISGLAYDYQALGTPLYGSAWDTQWLYSIDLAAGTASQLYDMSGDLQGYVFGLDNPVPEPLTMLGVFMGVAGLAGYIRRRRMA